MMTQTINTSEGAKTSVACELVQTLFPPPKEKRKQPSSHVRRVRLRCGYVNIRVSRRLKEELSWAIDKRLRLISNTMLFKTVLPLRI